MFRIRTFVTLLGGFLVLAVVSRPLLTAVHNRLAKLGGGAIPAGFFLGTMEKDAQARQPANTSCGKLPIYFEPNLGQTDPQVKFIARGSGATTFLTATGAVFSLPIVDFRLSSGKQSIKRVGYADPAGSDQRPVDLNPWNFAFGRTDLSLGPNSQTPSHSSQSAIANRQSAISMKLVGANPNATVEGLDRLPGISNYFIGNDPKNWRTNIPHYAKVCYRDVYPGIDLVYRGDAGEMEYDWPGGGSKSDSGCF